MPVQQKDYYRWRVEMNIPPGSQGGQRFRLKRQGLLRKSGNRGDQYVRLKIVLPPMLNDQQRELLAKMRDISGFDARESARAS